MRLPTRSTSDAMHLIADVIGDCLGIADHGERHGRFWDRPVASFAWRLGISIGEVADRLELALLNQLQPRKEAAFCRVSSETLPSLGSSSRLSWAREVFIWDAICFLVRKLTLIILES